MKIREVIEIPHIDKIVRLTDNMSDEADKNELKTLLKGYVITHSVEKNLSNFFYKITNFKEKGHGFLISGLPGCGKSHFMSVLGLLAKHNETFEIMSGKSKSIDDAKEYFQNKKIFVIPVMAEEGGPDISLEEMLFEAAENISGFPFTEASYYISQFEEAIVSNNNYEKKVDEFIRIESKGVFYTWADFKSKIKSQREITKTIKNFIDENNIGFFKPNRGRTERLNNLYEWLYNEGYDGVLVLIDELSEYLNDRGNAAREDALFLKVFLENTERIKNGKVIPAWIVGAFLSSLNDIKVPEVYDLMKDRFPSENQFTLKVDDIEDIIDQRLVIKKHPERIEEAYMLLKNKYTAFSKVEKNMFMKIYPLHPESLEILAKSVRFLSRQRSIVDFFLSEVKGNVDEGGQTQGILDEDYLKLVTPDRILVHFEERIRELSDKREYFDSIYSYYLGPEGLGNGKVKELFKDKESDKNTAIKLINVMTLLKILDLDKEYTVRDLTYMIQFEKMEKELAEVKINKILNTMYDKGRFIEYIESENSIGDNIYYINKDVSLLTKINQDLKKKIALLEGDNIKSITNDFKIIDVLSHEPINIREYYNEVSSININFNNINRNGLVLFNSLNNTGTKESLSKALNILKDTENDFYLYIGTFLDIDKQKKMIESSLEEINNADKVVKFSIWGNNEDDLTKDIEKRMIKSIVYWLPSSELETEEGKENLNKLKEYFAYNELLKDYREIYEDNNTKENKELVEKVEEKILNFKDEVFIILKNIYLSGKFYNLDGEIDIDISTYTNSSLNKIITSVITRVLNNVYKDNKFIAPDQFISLTDKVTNKFVNTFILGNELEVSLQSDINIVKNVVKKFGATTMVNSFKFSVDAKNNNLVKLIIDQVSNKKTIIYKDLYNKIRKSSFGPNKNITEILISMMIKKGFLLPIKNDNVISISNIKAPLNTSVSKFKMGEFVDEKYEESLIRITRLFFNKKFEKQDLSFQEELWQEFKELKEEINKEINKIEVEIREFKESLDLNEDKFKLTKDTLEFILKFIEYIYLENSSKDGLEYFIENNKEYIESGKLQERYNDFNKIKEWIASSIPGEIRKVNIKGYKDFIPERAEYNYLLTQLVELKEILNNGDEFIFGEFANELNRKFICFKNDYISIYVEEHNRENEKEEFEGLKEVLSFENYKFLALISQIESINVDYDYNNISEDIQKQLSTQCKLSAYKHLEEGESSCRCLFKLGNKKYVDKQDSYYSAINAAILSYIDQLNLQANKAKVMKYINDLNEIGEKKNLINLVCRMYEIPIDKNRLDNYKNFIKINPEIIPFLNKALIVNINIVQRDINKLIEVFKDKTYSKEEIINKFTQIVNGNDDTIKSKYIKFTDLRSDK